MAMHGSMPEFRYARATTTGACFVVLGLVVIDQAPVWILSSSPHLGVGQAFADREAAPSAADRDAESGDGLPRIQDDTETQVFLHPDHEPKHGSDDRRTRCDLPALFGGGGLIADHQAQRLRPALRDRQRGEFASVPVRRERRRGVRSCFCDRVPTRFPRTGSVIVFTCNRGEGDPPFGGHGGTRGGGGTHAGCIPRAPSPDWTWGHSPSRS